ncbi:conserved hypothetical protein [Vibrio chagasii]|nr:conserved hypothetical protein [Vibrio chagasii]CAH7412230.1 conserved hypothetical protein [Vibrio chagasii]
MNSRIKLNYIKYAFFELLFVAALVALVYWLSGGYNQTLRTTGLIFPVAVAIKTVGLWWKLHNISFEISNGYVLFDGYACDIKLQGSILPFGIGSFIKLSYTKGAMQKRNIYLPKGAMNKEEWTLVLACRR